MSDLKFDLSGLLGQKTAGAGVRFADGRSTPAVQKLRTTHHELARMLAIGYKDVDVARITGYSQSRICILKTDPMFQELLAHYSAQRDSIVTDVGARLRGLSLTAMETLQERIEDDPDSVSINDLRRLAEMGLDRTGYGPTAKVETRSVVAIQTLEEIKAAIHREHKGRVLSRDQGTEDCVDAEFTTIEPPQAEEAPGGSSPGDEV